MKPPIIPALLTALALTAAPAAGFAQAVVQPLGGYSDADRLAAAMRRLAADAQDLPALVEAGELSLRLGDLSGAASLFARADKIDPRNGRVKAGMGSILVRAERPGEALRYFQTAESYGFAPGGFAADRGLAYDLIGEQERAQRDYRLALRTRPDDETVRRYALSLGISGNQQLALQQLEPLLRKTDRGAWRVRAFVLAMGGNAAEASRIATTMMPPGTAAGLQPFFRLLPSLPAADRAFAVTFGEVRATPERVADARLTPALAALGPDPDASRVQMASAQPTQGLDRKERKRRNRSDEAAAPVQVATAQPAPAVPAYRPPYRSPGAPLIVAQETPVPAPTVPPVVYRASAPMPTARLAQAGVPRAAWVVQPAPSSVSPPAVTMPPRVASVPAAPPAIMSNLAALAHPGFTAAASGPAVPVQLAAVAPAPRPAFSAIAPAPGPVTPAAPLLPSNVVSPVQVASAPASTPFASATSAVPATIQTTALPPSTVAQAAAAPVDVAAAPAVSPPANQGSEDAVLARIVASLSVPASELGIEGPHRTVPAPAPAAPDAGLAEARAAAAHEAAQKKAAVDKLAAAEKAAADRANAAKALADKKAADRKAAAAAKALAEKKAAAEEKAEEAKAAAEAKKVERANPARIWVQVAGGASEDDLPRAWAAVKAKAPDAFAGHSGWTTPLRATNRVLTGPFKTDDEARSFVNQLARKGISAFTFSSEAGQVVMKLPARK